MQTQTASQISTAWKDNFSSHVFGAYSNPKTAALALQHIRVFSMWYEAEFQKPFEPSDLVNYHFKLYRAHSLEREKVRAATWNSRLWALTVFCEWLESPELLSGVCGKDHSAISEKYRSLTQRERRDLIVTCQKDVRGYATQFDYYCAVRDYAIIAVMLECGLRVAEVAALNVDDIIIGERSGYILVRNGKGGKERKVPLTSEIVRPAVSAWIQVRASTTSDNALFIGKEGRLTVRSLQRIVRSIAARIGAPDITPHCLRYEFAKNLQRKGLDVIDISRLLGHNSVEVTKRYLRSSMDDLLSKMEGVQND